ncbi:MAG: hypothetical protein IAE90_07300 [Ignavibacteria bacterium]|nr:hypothetical protein [Ignavibacteria bacterium]
MKTVEIMTQKKALVMIQKIIWELLPGMYFKRANNILRFKVNHKGRYAQYEIHVSTLIDACRQPELAAKSVEQLGVDIARELTERIYDWEKRVVFEDGEWKLKW